MALQNEANIELQKLRDEIAEIRAQNEKAWSIARDCINALTNAKITAENGQLGTLSHSNVLSDAPVGDAEAVRKAIKALGPEAALSSLPVGDADAVRRSVKALGPETTLSSLPVGDVDALRSSIHAMRDSETLETLPVGTAWKTRQRLGLGNDDEGRGSLGLGSAATRNAAGSGDLMAVGYRGWGSQFAAATPHTSDQLDTGVYAYTPNVDKPGEVGDYGIMLNLQNNGPDWRCKLYFRTYSGRIYYSSCTNSTWSTTGELMIKGTSCTVDGNGYLKPSSPIVRLGKTIVESGFIEAGYGVVNKEAEGVRCMRVAEGKYEVTGSLGFADDNTWTIETPRDKNNQPLLWVSTSQLPDGTLTIETFHRTHPDAPPFARNTVAGKSDGDPIDIPEGRWIDLRLKMTEKTSDMLKP